MSIIFGAAESGPIRWALAALEAARTGAELLSLACAGPSPSTLAAILDWLSRAHLVLRPGGLASEFSSRSNVMCKYLADDGVWRMPFALVPLAPELIQVCMSAIGVSIKPGSWQAWSPVAFPRPVRLRLEVLSPRVSVLAPASGMVVAGSPISDIRSVPAFDLVVGGDAFLAVHCSAVVERARWVCSALVALPGRAAATYPSERSVLLSVCSRSAFCRAART